MSALENFVRTSKKDKLEFSANLVGWQARPSNGHLPIYSTDLQPKNLKIASPVPSAVRVTGFPYV